MTNPPRESEELAHPDDTIISHALRWSLGIAAVLAVIGAGLWLAETMAQMRKDQDCVLSGQRGCTPVEYNKVRW